MCLWLSSISGYKDFTYETSNTVKWLQQEKKTKYYLKLKLEKNIETNEDIRWIISHYRLLDIGCNRGEIEKRKIRRVENEKSRMHVVA